jgi:serine protease Do
MKRKLLKLFLASLFVMFFGWLGNLFLGRYLTPFFIESKLFSDFQIFRNDNKNTTIINNKESIVVGEAESIGEIASNAVYAIVEIMSFEKNVKGPKAGDLNDDRYGYLFGKHGAGTILTNDGVIVTYRTNILEKNSDYKVKTLDGNILKAVLLGVDEFSDLAYLKVENSNNLTTLQFSNLENLREGQKIIAIGSLTGDQKVYLANGVLSGFENNFNLNGSDLSSSEKLERVLNVDFNQNDKYIGGPIINHSGELVAISAGVNIDKKMHYYQIAVDVIKDSMQKIVENRIDQVAKLGVYYISLNSYYQNLKNLPVDSGALIYSSTGKQNLSILSGSSAEKAGLRIGDIILSVDGNEVNVNYPLSSLVNQYEKGSEASLIILRNGEKIDKIVEF